MPSLCWHDCCHPITVWQDAITVLAWLLSSYHSMTWCHHCAGTTIVILSQYDMMPSLCWHDYCHPITVWHDAITVLARLLSSYHSMTWCHHCAGTTVVILSQYDMMPSLCWHDYCHPITVWHDAITVLARLLSSYHSMKGCHHCAGTTVGILSQYDRMPSLWWHDCCHPITAWQDAITVLAWLLSSYHSMTGCHHCGGTTVVILSQHDRMPSLCWHDCCHPITAWQDGITVLAWLLSSYHSMTGWHHCGGTTVVILSQHDRMPSLCWHDCCHPITAWQDGITVVARLLSSYHSMTGCHHCGGTTVVILSQHDRMASLWWHDCCHPITAWQDGITVVARLLSSYHSMTGCHHCGGTTVVIL